MSIADVKAEAARWRKKQRETLFVIEQALEASPAIRGMSFGGEPRMAILSGELSDLASGNYRLTFFGPDGPYGHVTKQTKEEIAKEALETMKQPIAPMTDAEVMDWTSTPEFEFGTAIIAYMQAENTLRWYAQKAGRLDWAYDVINRAHELWRGGQTPENVAAAMNMVVAAFRQMPVPNPRRHGYLVPNPPWVTSALADSYETLERQVPPRWLPELARVTARRGKVEARFVEFGCGAYGCVLPTLDPKTVLKVTTDDTEAEFAANLSPDLVVPIVVDYRMVASTSGRHQGLPITLLWREAADHVGKIVEVVGGADGDYRATIQKLIDDQHAIAQYAYKALMEGKLTAASMALKYWLETCEQMARGQVPELRPLGRGLIELYERQQIFFGDIHAGNLGLVHRDTGDAWVITDPGHVAVVNLEMETD